jgi:SAM-dependent methyltransferase
MQLSEFELMYRLEDRLWWYRGMRRITAALLDRCYPRGGHLRILDGGCGTGATAALLANYGCVTGVDVEAYALQLARQRGQSGLAHGSVTALPFAEASFDLVTCFDVLVMLDEPAEYQALAELARVLAPGGRLLVRVAANDWLRGAHDRAWLVVRRYEPARLRASLAQAGLVVERVSHANMWLFPLAAAKRLAERLAPPRTASDLTYAYGRLDGVLGGILSSEARLIAGPGLPFGLSLMALARKPQPGAAQPARRP